MSTKTTLLIVAMCAALAVAPVASATGISALVTATAFEVGGTQPDVFSLTFACDCDIRILQVIFDMTPSAGHLFFDTAPEDAGGWDFHSLPDAFFPGYASTASVFQYFSADNSPQLVIQFTEFKPGQVLYFDIDVDGPLSTTFTAADFAGTGLGIIFDPSPAFPGAQPVGVVYRFTEFGGQAVVYDDQNVNPAFGNDVPEPATMALMLGGGAMLVVRRFRKRS